MMAGSLNRIIIIRRRVEVGYDAANYPIFEWRPVHKLAANVRYLRADERFDNGASQVFAWSTVAFKTRWVPGLMHTDVITFDGRNYNITGFAEIGRRVGMEITATWRQGALT